MPPRRRLPPPPQPEIKQFTANEIEQGIWKLRRRIEDVKALDPQRDQEGLAKLVGGEAIAYKDQRVRNAEQAISTTILGGLRPKLARDDPGVHLPPHPARQTAGPSEAAHMM